MIVLYVLSSILLWMAIGALVLTTVITIHLLRAERKGYEAIEDWAETYKDLRDILGLGNLILSLVGTCIVWPVQVIMQRRNFQILYTLYDRKDDHLFDDEEET